MASTLASRLYTPKNFKQCCLLLYKLDLLGISVNDCPKLVGICNQALLGIASTPAQETYLLNNIRNVGVEWRMLDPSAKSAIFDFIVSATQHTESEKMAYLLRGLRRLNATQVDFPLKVNDSILRAVKRMDVTTSNVCHDVLDNLTSILMSLGGMRFNLPPSITISVEGKLMNRLPNYTAAQYTVVLRGLCLLNWRFSTMMPQLQQSLHKNFPEQQLSLKVSFFAAPWIIFYYLCG